jgi:hypothetical protein
VDDLNAFVSSNIGVIAVALAVAALVLLGALVLTARQARRLDRRLAQLTRGGDGESLEAVLKAHLDRVDAVGRELAELRTRTVSLETVLPRAFQRIGLVRFNPFEDTGGNQSFAVALLDARGDGFVISSLHARSGTRVYGKTVAGGASESTLSTEEAQAVKLALASPLAPARTT